MNTLLTSETPLRRENAELRARLEETERALRALRAAKAEAPDVQSPGGQPSAEAELRHAMELVEIERQRFSKVLDQLPAYLVLLAPDHHVPFANRFFEERFGKSEGRRCYEYLFNRTDPCERCESFEALKTNAPHRWEWTGPDGRIYDIYDFPFTDVGGSSLIMEVGLDITERRKIESELTQYRAHLEELVRERTGQLAETNTRLEAEIAARTRAAEELRLGNQELQRFNRAMVGRELRMVELKREVNELCAQAGQPPRYPEVLEKEQP